MSAQTASNARSIKPERLNTVRFASQPTSTQITNGRALFTWMWRQLERSEPRLAVSGYVPSDLDLLFRTIREGRVMPYPPIEWSVIFAEIRWDDVNDRSGPHCARILLEVVGQLCATVICEGGGCVSPIRACEMMLQYWDIQGTYIHYEDGRRGTYLVSTSACERKFGVRIRVKLMDEPLEDDWTLEGSPDLI